MSTIPNRLLTYLCHRIDSVLLLRKKLTRSTLALILIFSPLLGFAGWICCEILLQFCLPPPLFHEWVGVNRSLEFTRPIIPLSDRAGNFGYADFDRNFLAVLITENSQTDSGVFPVVISSSEAKLLPGSAHEATVYVRKNTLVFIRPDGVQQAVEIPPGSVRNWYLDFLADDRAKVRLPQKILNELPQDTRSQLGM